jgi:hypothetical protein
LFESLVEILVALELDSSVESSGGFFDVLFGGYGALRGEDYAGRLIGAQA